MSTPALMKKQTYLLFALLAAVAVIIMGMILHFAGVSFENWAQWVEALPFVVLVFVNAFVFSKVNDRNVTFGEVFASNFKLTIIVAIIMGIWAVVSLSVFPGLKEAILEQMEKRMMERAHGDVERVEQEMVSARKYFEAFGAGILFFTYLLWGSLVSLLAAVIVKKKAERLPDAHVQ